MMKLMNKWLEEQISLKFPVKKREQRINTGIETKTILVFISNHQTSQQQETRGGDGGRSNFGGKGVFIRFKTIVCM